MTNNLQFVELMASIGKSNSRKKLNIQLACFGLVAVSVAVFLFIKIIFMYGTLIVNLRYENILNL